MNERRNLQFCNVMVNYDLPWNPMKVEQRIGRIHRIGQDQEVYVFNIALEAFPDAKITVFHVVGEPSAMWGEAMGLALADDIGQAAGEHASDAFEGTRAIADEYDREIATDVQVGHPTRAILNTAEGFGIVVISPHGGSLADRFLMGHVAETVFRRSPIPVTVVR